MKPDYKNWVPKSMVYGWLTVREAAWPGLSGSTLLVGKK